MQTEKIALVTLVIVVIAACSIFLYVNYGDEFFKSEPVVEMGDYVDVHYIGKYASNGTVFEYSYDDLENMTGDSPLYLFVTLNSSEYPEDDYADYSNLIGQEFVKGLIEGVVGMKEGETKTIGPIAPENAYGLKPTVDDLLDLTELVGVDYVLKIVDIEEDVPMPEEFSYYFPGVNTTTVYNMRIESHYIGEIIDEYPSWTNATVVTKINDTMLWTYTTPTTEIGENFSWIDIDAVTGIQTTYPEDSSQITALDDDTIVITHTPAVGSIISSVSLYGGEMEYTVENVTDDKINTSYLLDPTDTVNKSYYDFDRTTTVSRNNTENITSLFPEEYLSMFLMYLRAYDAGSNLSLSPLAGEDVTFEVEIVEIHKPTTQE